VYDNVGRLLSENTGSATRDYVWAGNTLVAVLDTPAQGGDTLHYVYTDGLGTPRAITTQDGAEVWDWPAVQNPFGERAASGNEYTFNLRFPGQYFDQETGLHYNYHRDYEPVTGRYVESDPIGLQGGISAYGYAYQNPFLNSDSSGLLVWTSSATVYEYDYYSGNTFTMVPGANPDDVNSKGLAVTTATWSINSKCHCDNGQYVFDQYKVDYHAIIHLKKPIDYPDHGENSWVHMSEDQHVEDLENWAEDHGRSVAKSDEDDLRGSQYKDEAMCEKITRNKLQHDLYNSILPAIKKSWEHWDRSGLHSWNGGD
jgi:RHS repeat-associated protein